MDVSGREQRWRSYSSFGLFREDREREQGRVRPKTIARFRVSFGLVALALLAVTVVFFIIEVTRPPRTTTLTKAKRFVNYRDLEAPNVTEGKSVKSDVSIVPESKVYSNHRYDPSQSDSGIMQRMIGDMYAYNDWSPVTFEDRPKNRNNIRDIIQRIEMGKELGNLREKRVRQGLRKPILFKGVYMRQKSQEKNDGAVEGDRVEYFKEINEMLQGDSKDSSGRAKSSGRDSAYSDRASPFRLRSPADESSMPDGAIRKMKNPITVMLDIYPMARPEEEEMKHPKAIARRPKGGPIYVPLRSDFEPVSSAGRNVAYTLVPLRGGGKSVAPRRSRMIMKLNLYPKGRKYGSDVKEGRRPTMDRRTFGWLGKDRDGHLCQLVGHNPKGRPVTAEWKDEDGNWIKANYLTLKYWDGQSS